MRSDRLRLSCRALKRRQIGDRTVMRVRDLVVGDIERAHGTPPIVPSSNVAHRACVFQPMISDRANLRRGCRANAAPCPPRKCHEIAECVRRVLAVRHQVGEGRLSTRPLPFPSQSRIDRRRPLFGIRPACEIETSASLKPSEIRQALTIRKGPGSLIETDFYFRIPVTRVRLIRGLYRPLTI